MKLDRQTIDAARRDPGVFAEVLVGAPLWGHQLEFARSPARIRTMCSGRRAGKTHAMAIEALHVAFTKADARVLVCSAGEDSAKDLLAACSLLASSSPLIGGSVLDDTATLLTLSNGSTIRAVPASEKRVRGKGVDLLLMDEAAYIDEDIWKAAQWSLLDRPGSRAVLASTPRGNRKRFFGRYFFMAKDGPIEEAGVTVESFHWPSTVSPRVDLDLLEFWRRTEDPRTFALEVEAIWQDEAGQYFTSDELDANVAPFQQTDPEAARGAFVVGGVDWGGRNDSNAVVMVGALGWDSRRLDKPTYAVAMARERLGSMNDWARDLARWSDPEAGGFNAYALASEMNGVGTGPTELLQSELQDRGRRSWTARGVWTTNTRKANGFGRIKLLLQQGRLVLPSEPALRRQLEALEYSTTEAGNTTIAVPTSKGHDDLAMSLCQAASCLNHNRPGQIQTELWGFGDLLATPSGAEIYERPTFSQHGWALRAPTGSEDEDRGW